MTGYYNNLALHITDATLKAHRRLTPEPTRSNWSHIVCALLGAAAAWLVAAGFLG